MGAVRFALGCLFGLLLSLSAAFAFDPALIGQSERTLQDFRSDLDRAIQQTRKPDLSDRDLADLKAALEKLRTDAAARAASLASPLSEVNQQLNSLGPAPAAGASEEEGVAKTRAELTTSRDRLQSIKSQLDVLSLEAEQSAGRISALQRQQFVERIFDRNRSILNPTLWYDTAVGLGVLGSGLVRLFRNWWTEVSPTANPLGLLLVPVVILLFAGGYGLVNRWIVRWMDRYSGRGRSIDDMSRLWRVVRAALTTLVALAILILPIRLALEASGYFTPRMLLVWNAVTTTMVATFVYYTLGRRLASPGQPEWRIVDLDDRAAGQFTLLVGLISFVAALHGQMANVAEGLYLSVHYTIGQSAFAALVLLILMSLILLTLRNQEGLAEPQGRRLYFRWTAALTPFIWALILAGFAALLLGYLALANYIAHQMVRTSMVMGVVFILYHLSDAAVAASFDPQSGFGTFLRRATGLGERAIERLGLIFRMAVDFVLVLAGIPLLVLLWTLTWVDLSGYINTLAIGVKVGEFTISPGMVVLVLVIVATGIIATKLFNRWLDRRILSDTRINKGVQDSILKGASYTGYILATGFALTAAGLDFSNLALIAGALGVGIGFGLQSIVNNFVSGLIILAERPIRVGDWVVLPSGEGIVRRINVRSTEIETFDSCSIILPNSQLVTEPVRNWTHKDNMGRFLIAVTVEYGSEPEQVRKILLEAAREHPKVLTFPEPVVTLARFSPTGLDFELRATVADILQGAQVASDIRFDLLNRLREKDITIAHPVALMQAPKA